MAREGSEEATSPAFFSSLSTDMLLSKVEMMAPAPIGSALTLDPFLTRCSISRRSSAWAA